MSASHRSFRGTVALAVVLVAPLALGLATTALADDPTAPKLSGIAPSVGPTGGGTTVEVKGRNFDRLPAGTLGILFGDVPANNVARVSSKLIVCTAPPSAHPAFVAVHISIDGAAYEPPGRDRFRYVDGPAVTTTTTTTTTLVGQTTTSSTTLPPSCATDGTCDDDNVCTLDSCDTHCRHKLVSVAADLVGEAEGCASVTVPTRIANRFLHGCKLAADGSKATKKRQRHRLFVKAVRTFKRAVKLAEHAGMRAHDPLPASCASDLATVLGDAQARAERLRDR